MAYLRARLVSGQGTLWAPSAANMALTWCARAMPRNTPPEVAIVTGVD
jgi:hypothetical protein